MDASDSQTNYVADLTVQVYAIHEVIIQESGGIHGLRDGAMLHAAIARPFATFAGQELYPTDFDKAAALLHSLIKSHPFMDGTKRTAFTAALYWLENSGHRIPSRLPKDEIICFCISIAEENSRRAQGEFVESKTIPEIADWFHYLLESSSYDPSGK